jgi:hypothetical protein
VNFGTHKKPHGDELCAFAFAMRFDPEYKDASIFTFGSKEEAIAAARKSKDITLIGIGEGKYDEHGKNIEESAATLVAGRLKVDELMYFRLLEEVRSCDLQAKARRTHISEILKILYDHNPEEEVIKWGLKAYGVLIDACEAGNYKPSPTDVLEEVAAELTTKFTGTGRDNAMTNAWRDCQAAVNNSRSGLTELRTVADIIALSSVEEAKKWVAMGIEALFHRQLDFEKALEEVKVGYRFIVQWARQDGAFVSRGQFFGVAIYSDNSQSIRAFRSNRAGNLDLLIVRNKSGHVQIFSNSKSNIPMVQCVKAIRFAEAQKKGIKVNLDDLGGEGDCEYVRYWHYFAKGGMLMNGSKSHPGVEVTKLSDNEIVRAVQGAFNKVVSSLSNRVLR